MANPTSLRRPPSGHRYDPTAIDATGATLGHVLTAVSDGTGGQRAGYAAPSGSGISLSDAIAAALEVDGNARIREASLSGGGTIDDAQIWLLAQFYGA